MDSGGDGIDVNGSATMTDGTFILNGPTGRGTYQLVLGGAASGPNVDGLFDAAVHTGGTVVPGTAAQT